MSQLARIDFTAGSRRLLSVERRLSSWSFTLDEILSADPLAASPPPAPGADGLRVLSAPIGAVPSLEARFDNHIAGARQDYRRHYIDMQGSYEDYLARFSGKTRSTLRRKDRKLEQATRHMRVTAHASPAEVETFLAAALPLSARTYQARLLDAGLPDSPQGRHAMLEAAEAGLMRCFLLHADGAPIAYLSLPVTGRTLVYAHLGYDPDWASLSPGTVLQMRALEQLFAEERFAYFDFTEGDGAHKALFGTDSVECASFVLLRKTLANRALLGSRAGFDRTISLTKSIAARSGALGKVRGMLRA